MMASRFVILALAAAACGAAEDGPVDAGAPPVCTSVLDAVHAPPPIYPIGIIGAQVILADVDDDGDRDAVVSDHLDHPRVLLADGQGRFTAAIDVLDAEGPIAIDDLEGTGTLELIAATSSGAALGVWHYDDAGTYTLAATAPLPLGALGIVTGDVDADLDVDVVVVGFELGVFLNDGSGQLVRVPEINQPFDVEAAVLADLDGDGRADLVGSSWGNELWALSSATGFGIPFPIGLPDVPVWALAAVDLDDDGDMDIAAAGKGLARIENHGDWNFTAEVRPIGWPPLRGVAAGDLDGDGRIDVAGADETGVWVWPAGGSPRLVPVHRAVADVEAGDLDGDRDTDLVATTWPGELAVLSNEGLGVFAPPPPGAFPASGSPEAIVAADLDGDGALDLATASTVFLQRDGGWVDDSLNIWCERFEGLIAGDLDNDGDTDLAVACELEAEVLVALNDGVGEFFWSVVKVGTKPEGLVTADLDRDGDLDLITAGYQPAGVAVLRNDGTGWFASEPLLPAGEQPESVIAVDLDGDADLDLAVADEGANRVHLLANDGLGSFAALGDFAAGGNAQALTAGDIDGDGSVDIIVADGGQPWGVDLPGGIIVLFGDGLGGVSEPVAYPAGLSPRDVAIADLDGDGDADVLAADSRSNDVAILPNDGLGRLAAPVFVPAGASPFAVIAADLDNVCGPEVVVANKGGSVTIIRASPVVE